MQQNPKNICQQSMLLAETFEIHRIGADNIQVGKL
jgi:hypothetical protein